MLVLYFTELLLGSFGTWTCEYKQKLCFIHSNGFKIGSFYNKTVNKSIYYELANSMTCLGLYLVLDQLCKQTLCVGYFNELI